MELKGEGYIPTYIRTDLTDELHEKFNFRTDTQIVGPTKMKKIINQPDNIVDEMLRFLQLVPEDIKNKNELIDEVVKNVCIDSKDGEYFLQLE